MGNLNIRKKKETIIDETEESENIFVFIELIRTLYQRSYTGIWINLANSLILVVFLTGVLPIYFLLSWFSVQVTFNLFRLYYDKFVLKNWTDIPLQKAEVYERNFIFIAAISGIIWGSLAFSPMDAVEQNQYFILTTFVVGGMNAGATSSMSVSIKSFIGFLFFSLTPFAYRFFTFGDKVSALMGFFLFVFAAGLYYLCLQGNRNARWSLQQKSFNKSLFSEIVALKNESEQAKIIAEQANKFKSEFLANMSHEIRTPMNAILGFTEILEKKISGSQEQQYLQSIKSGSKTLLRLINDILDLSKVEAGKMQLEYKEFDFRDMANDIREIFSAKATERNLEFQMKIDPKIPGTIILDEIRLRQILLNLVSNAIKFTDTGYVGLSAKVAHLNKKSGKFDLSVFVDDTGVGIAKSELKNIFDSFSQQKGHSAKYGGTGLGLTISKRLANMMGGDISVSSHLGKGSQFQVLLQRVRVGTGNHALKIAMEYIDSITFDPATVLIVDDVASNRNIIKAYFENSGLTFIDAENGKSGIEIAELYKPDLIIMDLKMPVMDGYEATKIIKKDSNLKTIPVLISSATELVKIPKKIVKLTDGYLQKPFNKTEIITALMKILEFASLGDEEWDFAKDTPADENLLGNVLPENSAEFLQKLESDILAKWKHVSQGVDFDVLKEFADEVKTIGSVYEYSPLIRWSDQLSVGIASFNVEMIKTSIEKLPPLIQRIKEAFENAMEKTL
ncbi:MAG: ATP-binding protein [Leptospirales bacterium]